MSAEHIGTMALVTVTGVALYLCWLVARPFVSVITWGVALAVVAYPWQRWLERRVGQNLAAFLAVLSVAIALVAPVFWLSHQLFQEATTGLQLLGPELKTDAIQQRIKQHALLANILEQVYATLNLDEEIQRVARTLAAKLSSLLGNSIWVLTQLFLTFVTLFFFFRDRKTLLDLLRGMIPLSPAETSEIFQRVSITITACRKLH